MPAEKKKEFVLEDRKEHLGAETKPEFHYTNEQLGVTREFKKMLGDVLDVVEAVIPAGLQLDKTKRLVQNKMYDGLKAILGELE